MTATVTLLNAVTATGQGAAISAHSDLSYQAVVAGTGAVSATVVIRVSNDGTNWIDMATITLSGTTSATDGFSSNADWMYVAAAVTAISGTAAAVTVKASRR